MERNGFLQNVNFCWDFMKWRGNKPFIDCRYQLKLPKLITNVFLYYLFFKILFMMTHHSFSYIKQTRKVVILRKIKADQKWRKWDSWNHSAYCSPFSLWLQSRALLWAFWTLVSPRTALWVSSLPCFEPNSLSFFKRQS